MAFAIAMILFSTIVTGIVELIMRLFGVREKNLQTTLESLFENVVWPRMKSRFVTVATDKDDDQKDLDASPLLLKQSTSVTS